MSLTAKEFNLIKELTSLNGVSGYEKDIREYLKEKYSSLGYSFIFDNLGGIFAYKKSDKENAFTVMIDAHMDEVGFISSHIVDDKTISLIPVGGLSPKEIENAKMQLIANNKTFYGQLSIKDDNYYLILDNPISNIQNEIPYGSLAYFATELYQISENRYIAKAYDDRYGVALGLEILEYFKDKELPFNLFVGGSVQEEVGLRGATLNLDYIKPDLAIVLDCSRASNDDIGFGRLGEGVLIRYFDRAMVAFKELLDLQIKCCLESDSKYQYFSTMGGTNAGAIHKHGNGILTLTHCVCGKNIHTHETEFDSNDYQSAKKSLIYLLENLDKKTLDELKGGIEDND